MKRLGVIIITLDRPAYLERCLAALEALHSRPGEIVVVDASDDRKSEEVADRFKGVPLRT